MKPEPSTTPQDLPDKCFVCPDGLYEVTIENRSFPTLDGKIVAVPAVPILRCDKCGDEIYPPESSRQVEAAVRESAGSTPSREEER